MLYGQAQLAQRTVLLHEVPMTDADDDGLAVWKRIELALRDEIARGVLPAGARVPTEAQLAARFNVNRHTIRRAVESLSRAGLVRVEQGRGSFVAEDLIDYTVGSRTRFSEWIRRHNMEPSGKTTDLRQIPADAATALANKRADRGSVTPVGGGLLRATVGPKFGVKASGGIRDTATALAMIEAGATRLGTSAGIAIVSGVAGTGGTY